VEGHQTPLRSKWADVVGILGHPNLTGGRCELEKETVSIFYGATIHLHAISIFAGPTFAAMFSLVPKGCSLLYGPLGDRVMGVEF
jgi:hypothetical protein